MQAAALAYLANWHTVAGHIPCSLVPSQEAVLPLSRQWHEPALCPLGVTSPEALWTCRVEVMRAQELAAKENARAQIVNVKPADVTADICGLATEHMATANQCRLKFLEANPQHPLHVYLPVPL